jgi:hypothetical protein
MVSMAQSRKTGSRTTSMNDEQISAAVNSASAGGGFSMSVMLVACRWFTFINKGVQIIRLILSWGKLDHIIKHVLNISIDPFLFFFRTFLILIKLHVGCCMLKKSMILEGKKLGVV